MHFRGFIHRDLKPGNIFLQSRDQKEKYEALHNKGQEQKDPNQIPGDEVHDQ